LLWRIHAAHSIFRSIISVIYLKPNAHKESLHPAGIHAESVDVLRINMNMVGLVTTVLQSFCVIMELFKEGEKAEYCILHGVFVAADDLEY
jgi:hypothetical protein